MIPCIKKSNAIKPNAARVLYEHCICFDISKAFYTIKHEVLLEILKLYLPGAYPYVVMDYIKNIIFRYSLGNKKLYNLTYFKDRNIGLMPGLSTSGKLFELYIQSMILIIKK
jgi:hypothetical protein